MNAEKKILDYVFDSFAQCIHPNGHIVARIIASIGEITQLVLAVGTIISGSIGFMGIVFVFVLSVPMCILEWMFIFSCFKKMRMIKILKAHNVYDDALVDFPTAVPFLNDYIRLGNNYILGKNSYYIYGYKDVCRVYKNIVTTEFYGAVNSTSTDVTLCAIDNSGKKIHLCNLANISDEDLIKCIEFMLHKNPEIAIGYKS